MSTQGTISTNEKSFEDELLECWGQWASSGLGTGCSRVGLWAVYGPGLMFSEDDILLADRAIAGLSPLYKKAIKKIFWFKSAGQKEYDIYPVAIESFRESLDRISKGEGFSVLP